MSVQLGTVRQKHPWCELWLLIEKWHMLFMNCKEWKGLTNPRLVWPWAADALWCQGQCQSSPARRCPGKNWRWTHLCALWHSLPSWAVQLAQTHSAVPMPFLHTLHLQTTKTNNLFQSSNSVNATIIIPQKLLRLQSVHTPHLVYYIKVTYRYETISFGSPCFTVHHELYALNLLGGKYEDREDCNMDALVPVVRPISN